MIPTMFKQVSPAIMKWAIDIGARHLVAVRQKQAGSSEMWSQAVGVRLLSECGSLFAVRPGGDGWDNPCICMAYFQTLEDANRCRAAFPDSEAISLPAAADWNEWLSMRADWVARHALAA